MNVKNLILIFGLVNFWTVTITAQTDTLGWDEFYSVSNECFEDPYQATGSNMYVTGANSFGNLSIAREYKNNETLEITGVIMDVFKSTNWSSQVADVTLYEMQDDGTGWIEPTAVAFVEYSPASDGSIPYGGEGNDFLVNLTFDTPYTVTGDFAVGINFGSSTLGGNANFVGNYLYEAFGVKHTNRNVAPPMGAHTWIKLAPFNVISGSPWWRLSDYAQLGGASLLDISVDMAFFPIISTNNTSQLDVSFNNSVNGASVNFLNTSTGINNPSYYWDFGNGTTSSDENPTVTYTQTGTYTVCLTITNSSGISEESCLDVYVYVYIIPLLANFSFNTIDNSMVNFFNNSTGDNIVSYYWSFGNGASSTEESPTFNFTESGTYTVCLTVTDNNNITNTSCNDVSIYIVDILKHKTDNLKISPNPVHSNLSVQIEDETIEEVLIFSIEGKMVMHFENQNLLDLSKLTKGNYSIQIKSNKNVYKSKLVKD